MFNLSPPPSKVPEFGPIWIRWIFRHYEQTKADNAVVIAPSMTTTVRDAMTAENGMIIYNTTTTVFNFYENGAWVTK